MSEWASTQDENGNTYYYNQATGETSWQAPPGFQQAGGYGGYGQQQAAPQYGQNDGSYDTASGMRRGPAPKATPSGIAAQSGANTGGANYQAGNMVVKRKASCGKRVCQILCCLFILILIAGGVGVGLFFASSATCDKMIECGADCWLESELTIPEEEVESGLFIENNWGNDFIGTESDDENKVFFKGNADEWGIFVYNQATAQADAQELMVVGKHPEEQIDDDGFVFLMRERGSGTGSVENKVFCRQASSYVKIAENNTHPYDIKVHKISEITAIDEGGDLWIGDLSNVDIREVDIQITKGTTSLNSALHATGDVVIDSTLTTDGEITTDGDFTVTTSQGDIKLDGGVVAAGHTLLSSSDLGGIEACHLSGTQGRLGCVVQGDTVKVDGGLSAVTLHHVIATSTQPAIPETDTVVITSETGDIYVGGITTSGNIKVRSTGRDPADGGSITMKIDLCDGFNGEMTIVAGEEAPVSWTCPSVTSQSVNSGKHDVHYLGNSCEPKSVTGADTEELTDVPMWCSSDNSNRKLFVEVEGNKPIHIDFVVPENE